MEKYPVPSGTPLVIHRRAALPKKTPAKKKISPEEQIAKLRRQVKRMAITMAILLLILAAAAFWLIREVLEPNMKPETTKGQNYSTQPTTTTTAPITTTTAPDSTADTTTGPDTTTDGN